MAVQDRKKNPLRRNEYQTVMLTDSNLQDKAQDKDINLLLVSLYYLIQHKLIEKRIFEARNSSHNRRRNSTISLTEPQRKAQLAFFIIICTF